MKTFAEFITEVEKNIEPIGSSYRHYFDVGRHRVQMHYSRIFRRDERKHYSVSFRVNGALHHFGGTSSEERHKIAHGVMGSVKHFVKTVRPHGLSASGNTKEKSKLYRKFWHHIAKHHPEYHASDGGWGRSPGIRRRSDPKPQRIPKSRVPPMKKSQERYHNPNQLRLDV
jgi:hypothetical protein